MPLDISNKVFFDSERNMKLNGILILRMAAWYGAKRAVTQQIDSCCSCCLER